MGLNHRPLDWQSGTLLRDHRSFHKRFEAQQAWSWMLLTWCQLDCDLPSRGSLCHPVQAVRTWLAHLFFTTCPLRYLTNQKQQDLFSAARWLDHLAALLTVHVSDQWVWSDRALSKYSKCAFVRENLPNYFIDYDTCNRKCGWPLSIQQWKREIFVIASKL